MRPGDPVIYLNRMIGNIRDERSFVGDLVTVTYVTPSITFVNEDSAPQRDLCSRHISFQPIVEYSNFTVWRVSGEITRDALAEVIDLI